MASVDAASALPAPAASVFEVEEGLGVVMLGVNATRPAERREAVETEPKKAESKEAESKKPTEEARGQKAPAQRCPQRQASGGRCPCPRQARRHRAAVLGIPVGGGSERQDRGRGQARRIGR